MTREQFDPSQPSGAAAGPPATESGAGARRRRALQVGLAAAAGLAGAGFAWWRAQPTEGDGEPAVQALWAMSFDRPEGGALAMAELRGRPLLLNFWATWCPPCVEEMPMLDRFFRSHGDTGWQVAGLAVDQPSAVRKFLERTPMAFPIGLAGFGGTELSRSLGNPDGKMPFSLVLGRDGTVLHRKIGQLSENDLQSWGAAVSR